MTTFTTTETRGGLIYTTTYRRTARTTTRLSMSETAAAPPALKQVVGQLKPAHQTVLHALRDLPVDSQREHSTLARRLRTADLAPFTDLSLLLDDLIRLGLVTRESQFKAGEAARIRLALTPAGRVVCEQLFGSLEVERRRLASLVETLLPVITQPVLADLLTAHLNALRAGQSPALLRSASSVIGPGHPRYETTLRFLARLGELPAGQSLEWKELAAELFPEIGGSKQLQGWQSFFEEITQANLGLSLAECGILTEESLYHVPLAGTICLANGSPLPGRFPALSNIDIAITEQVATPATWLLLVENRAVLLALGRQDYPARHNCLVCCTDGMVKHALIELVVKLSPRPSVLWVDWDIGGLQIASTFRRRLPDVVIVPHPGLVGEPVEVSSFTNHPDPAIVELATTIGRYGAIEQERLLRQVLTWDLAGLAELA